jgi:hypothetical protein
MPALVITVRLWEPAFLSLFPLSYFRIISMKNFLFISALSLSSLFACVTSAGAAEAPKAAVTKEAPAAEKPKAHHDKHKTAPADASKKQPEQAKAQPEALPEAQPEAVKAPEQKPKEVTEAPAEAPAEDAAK